MKPLKIAVILHEFFKRLRLLYLVMHQAVILALDLEIDISVIFILNITQAWSLFVELSWLLSCRSKRGTQGRKGREGRTDGKEKGREGAARIGSPVWMKGRGRRGAGTMRRGEQAKSAEKREGNERVAWTSVVGVCTWRRII